jgi:hypothetical protein
MNNAFCRASPKASLQCILCARKRPSASQTEAPQLERIDWFPGSPEREEEPPSRVGVYWLCPRKYVGKNAQGSGPERVPKKSPKHIVQRSNDNDCRVVLGRTSEGAAATVEAGKKR